MQVLKIKLLLGLDQHKARPRMLHCFRDRFGIKSNDPCRSRTLRRRQLHLQIRHVGQQVGGKKSLSNNYQCTGIEIH